MMKYVSKMHFAEDWLFLSRVVIQKLEKVKSVWVKTKCEDLEEKVIYLVLEHFHKVSEVP